MKKVYPVAWLRKLLGLEPNIKNDLSINTIKLGKEGASWTVCPDFLSNRSLVYSFGVGEDISFDLSLLRKFPGLKIYALDPTPRSISWIKKQILPKNFIFKTWGLGNKDGTAFFERPKAGNVSYKFSLKTCEDRFEILTLKSIVERLGHKRVDLVKMDIEGFEYGVIKNIAKMNKRYLPKQLLIEFHHRFSEFSKNDTVKAVTLLRKKGYQLFNVSWSQEYSFIRL